jgi:hypothetical protein
MATKSSMAVSMDAIRAEFECGQVLSHEHVCEHSRGASRPYPLCQASESRSDWLARTFSILSI